MGIDEYLMLIKLYHRLHLKLKDWEPADGGKPEYKVWGTAVAIRIYSICSAKT